MRRLWILLHWNERRMFIARKQLGLALSHCENEYVVGNTNAYRETYIHVVSNFNLFLCGSITLQFAMSISNSLRFLEIEAD